MENNLSNTEDGSKNSQSEKGDGWHRPQPENVAKPTYWPAVMALGVAFLGLGFVTTLPISGVGFGLIVLALAGWIKEIRHGD